MRFLVPLETVTFEARRKRELYRELQTLDAAMDSLLSDVRATRLQSGFVSHEYLSPSISAKLAALELGRSDLIHQRNVVLSELANL